MSKKQMQYHITRCMHNAQHCANWLQAQGFEVIRVLVGDRNPKIEIAASPLCNRLEGAVYMTERHAGQITRRGWVAVRFGCEVRWEGGAA